MEQDRQSRSQTHQTSLKRIIATLALMAGVVTAGLSVVDFLVQLGPTARAPAPRPLETTTPAPGMTMPAPDITMAEPPAPETTALSASPETTAELGQQGPSGVQERPGGGDHPVEGEPRALHVC